MKALFLAWTNYDARTELLGRALNAQVAYAWRLGRVRPVLLPLKYLLQAGETMAVLLRERPDVVLAQTPPVFVALIACVYAYKRNVRVVIDAHSGSFLSRKWRWSRWLHKWCSRRALITLVHMRMLLHTVQDDWGAMAMVLNFIGEQRPTGAPYAMPEGFNVAVPSSFIDDEPTEAILEAARRLPDVRFFITGDYTRLPAELLALKPENVMFTGYLPVSTYFGLLRSADAVLALTTQDHTFQCGGAEAVSLGRPLITSNWQALREVFRRGTVFVENSPASIADGIRQAQIRTEALTRDIRSLKAELDGEWQAKGCRLRALIAGSSDTSRVPVHDSATDKPATITQPELGS